VICFLHLVSHCLWHAQRLTSITLHPFSTPSISDNNERMRTAPSAGAVPAGPSGRMGSLQPTGADARGPRRSAARGDETAAIRFEARLRGPRNSAVSAGRSRPGAGLWRAWRSGAPTSSEVRTVPARGRALFFFPRRGGGRGGAVLEEEETKRRNSPRGHQLRVGSAAQGRAGRKQLRPRRKNRASGVCSNAGKSVGLRHESASGGRPSIPRAPRQA